MKNVGEIEKEVGNVRVNEMGGPNMESSPCSTYMGLIYMKLLRKKELMQKMQMLCKYVFFFVIGIYNMSIIF